MWELDHNESWVLNWCFWIVLLKRLKSPLDSKEIKPINPSVLNIHWTDWCWSWNFNTLATWCKELTHLKRPWCWERLKVGGEGDNRGWDGWLASPTRWTWIWASSGSWWWTGKPDLPKSIRLKRVGHDWVTELTYGLFQMSTQKQGGRLIHLFCNLPTSKLNNISYNSVI